MNKKEDVDLTVKQLIEKLLNYPMDAKIKFKIRKTCGKRNTIFEATNGIELIDATGEYPNQYVIISGK